MRLTIIILLLTAVSLHAQISGPTTASPNVNTLYQWVDDVVFSTYNWTVTDGIIVSKSRVGTTYKATVKFNCSSPQTLTFIGESLTQGTLSVTVQTASSAVPNTTFTYTNNCGSTIITRTTNPPSGTNWYWQSTSNGTSTANSGTTYTVSAPGTYYLRASNSTCQLTFSAAQSTAAVTVKVIPTVAASSQSICSGTATSIAITNPNNVSGTTFAWTISSTNATGASNGSGSSIAQTLTATASTNGTITYTITPTANGCSGTAVAPVATVKPLPNAAASAQSVFSGTATSIAITNPNNVSGTTFAWTANASSVTGSSNGTGSSIAQTLSTTIAPPSTGSVTYAITPTASSCPGTIVNVIATVYPNPAISGSNGGRLTMGGTTLDAGTGYTTYSWKNSANTVVGSAQTYTATALDTYSATVTKTSVSGSGIKTFQVTSQFTGQNTNYIVSTSTLTGTVTDPNTLGSLGPDLAQQSIQYFDGLGRQVQSIQTQGSPLKKDLVQPVAYDLFGRENKKYLPFISAENSGWAKVDPVGVGSGNYAGSAQYAAYNNGTSDFIVDDTKPYAETFFEASPLNRPIKQGSPGQKWQPNSNNTYTSTDHTVKSAYELNVASEVLLWTFTYDATYPFGKVNAGTAATPNYFAANSLSRHRTKDEQGNEVLEYADNAGRTIVKGVRKNAGAGTNLDNTYARTYYIYDDLGSLVCVIPPEATSRLDTAYYQTGATDPTKDNFLKRWAFRYGYDKRHRMILKQVPGADPVYLVYDDRDRLVMTQDGNQRAPKQWLFTKYDILNRPIITGIYTHGSTVDQAGMSALISTSSFYETYNGTAATHGYTNTIFPTTSTTVLTASYFDDYSFKTMVGGTTLDYVNNDLTGQSSSSFPYVNGHPTGVKVNILGSSNYLYSVSYYDDKYRVIQSISQNHKNGNDRTSSTYDFPGRVQETKTTHYNGSATHTVKRQYVYDHMSRIKQVFHATNTPTYTLLVQNVYNEIGQLVDKKLHSTNGGTSFKQSLDYCYNIRGWLLAMNNSTLNVADPDATTDLFGMELAYDTTTIGTGNNKFYNGNIGAMKWSRNLALGTIKDVAYNYDYDPMNRILSATYKQDNAGTWSNATGAFNESSYDYDLNGNIKSLTRIGASGATMDGLTYDYNNTSNKLLKVTDSGDKSTGFIEPTSTSGNDYDYDKNGNMTLDKNKGITAITYNHLNLPVQVNKGATDYIVYTYDASGRKLTQQVFGATPKTTDYLGEFIYEGNVLQFINHDEGRVVMTGASPEYQYHVKDHLGNVRLTFTASPPAPTNLTAGFETANQGTEGANFLHYPAGGQINTQATNAHAGSNSELLNGGYSGQVGVAKSFSVMPGDQVQIQAYAKYGTPSGTPANYTSFVAALLSAFNLSAPAQGETGTAASGVNLFGNWEIGASGDISHGDARKVFVTIILFDRNYNFLDVAYTASTATGALISASYTVKEPGYAYVYVSNEHTYLLDVYIDDVTVSFTQSAVVQTDDYYPFGLTFNSNGRQGNVSNQNKYNGKELQDELGLNWFDYGARMYMVDIGRWGVVDPLAEKSRRWTPYNYALNNPVRFIDPDGMEAEDPYLLYKGDEKKMEVWDDNDTPDDYGDDQLLSSNDAKNDVATTSNGKWEDGEYTMTDDSEPHTHGTETDNSGQLKDSDNGMYGSGGIYRANNFEETTTDLTRTGMGVHAGRENQNWDSGRKTNGCIRVTPEGFDAIGTAIEDKGPLTKIVVQNNRSSDNSTTVNAIKPGADFRAQAQNSHEAAVDDMLAVRQ